MQDRQELLKEAYRRGILPEDKKVAFEEAMKRGIIKFSEEETGGKEKLSQGRAALEQGLQGATFGFADELTDRLGAGIASIATGEKYSDLLKDARSNSRARLEGQTEQYPLTSLAANLGGVVGSGVAMTVPKTIAGVAANTGARGLVNAVPQIGSSISSGIRSGGLGARVAKGALAGAAGGGLYGAGAANDGERGEGAAQGALVAGALGAALPAAGAALSVLKRPGASPVTSATFRELANKTYKTAEEKGGILKPEFTNGFVSEIEQLKPQTEIGKLVGGETPFTKLAEKLSAIKNKPLTLEAAQELDEILGDEVDALADTVTGRLTKQGKKIYEVQSKLRNMIETADDSMIAGGKEGFSALKEARSLWAKSRRLEDVERIIARAEMTDNPATAIKTGFRTLATNPNRLKGYTSEEKKLIQDAAKSGIISDSLRTIFGSRLLPIITGASGAGIGGIASSQAASMAARGMAARTQLNKADKVASKIIGGLTPEQIGKLPPQEAMKLLKEAKK